MRYFGLDVWDEFGGEEGTELIDAAVAGHEAGDGRDEAEMGLAVGEIEDGVAVSGSFVAGGERDREGAVLIEDSGVEGVGEGGEGEEEDGETGAMVMRIRPMPVGRMLRPPDWRGAYAGGAMYPVHSGRDRQFRRVRSGT